MVFSLTDQCLHHTKWKYYKKVAVVFDTSSDTPTTVQHQHSSSSYQLFMLTYSYTSVSVISIFLMSLYSRVYCDHFRSNLLKVDVIQRRLAVKAKVFMLVAGTHVDELENLKFLK